VLPIPLKVTGTSRVFAFEVMILVPDVPPKVSTPVAAVMVIVDDRVSPP